MNRAGKYRLNLFFSSWRGLSCNNDSNTCHGLRPYIRTRIFRNRRNHCDCKREKGCNRSPIRKNKPLRFSPVLFRIRVLFLYRRSHETLRPFVRLVSRSLPYIRLQRLEKKVFLQMKVIAVLFVFYRNFHCQDNFTSRLCGISERW